MQGPGRPEGEHARGGADLRAQQGSLEEEWLGHFSLAEQFRDAAGQGLPLGVH